MCTFEKRFHSFIHSFVWNKTVKRDNSMKARGYEIVSITNCEWIRMPESKYWYRHPSPTATSTKTQEEILNDVRNDVFDGFVVYDIHVPEPLVGRFSEFPPIFKNCEITIVEIGEHMQEFCRRITRRKVVKRWTNVWGEEIKKEVLLDLPTQIGVAVFSYAKLRLIQFWDFINTFLVNDLYQLMECDTDSLHIVFAWVTIDECVKPEMMEGESCTNWKQRSQIICTHYGYDDSNSLTIQE